MEVERDSKLDIHPCLAATSAWLAGLRSALACDSEKSLKTWKSSLVETGSKACQVFQHTVCRQPGLFLTRTSREGSLQKTRVEILRTAAAAVLA